MKKTDYPLIEKIFFYVNIYIETISLNTVIPANLFCLL
jgi:hypothetical protein